MRRRKQQFVFPRAVLLVEIERHCADDRCRERNRIGLTKQEAQVYHGFTCARCERWHDDGLSERDVPDWWEELAVTGLNALRPRSAADEAMDVQADKPNEVVKRLSAAWRDREADATFASDAPDTEARGV
jgi:hypothetical protein